MKFRTLAVMAISALLVTSFAYAAPAALVADDMNGPGMTSAPSGTGGGNIGSSDNSNSSNSNDMSAGNTPPDAAANENDDMSADTATGDDDY